MIGRNFQAVSVRALLPAALAALALLVLQSPSLLAADADLSRTVTDHGSGLRYVTSPGSTLLVVEDLRTGTTIESFDIGIEGAGLIPDFKNGALYAYDSVADSHSRVDIGTRGVLHGIGLPPHLSTGRASSSIPSLSPLTVVGFDEDEADIQVQDAVKESEEEESLEDIEFEVELDDSAFMERMAERFGRRAVPIEQTPPEPRPLPGRARDFPVPSAPPESVAMPETDEIRDIMMEEASVARREAVSAPEIELVEENANTADTEDESPVDEFEREPFTMSLFDHYLIAPGDELDILFQIRTWQERDSFRLAVGHRVGVKFIHAPELNEDQVIRPDGAISLPYIGVIHVTGKTVEGLTEELKDLYADVLRDPELYVVVPEFNRSINELKEDLHTANRGLSRLTTVRPDGYATFPLLGDVKVTGKTIPVVADLLTREYDNILPGLHVDLFLERHAGTVVYVVGEVRRPGAFQMQKPITVAQALALAGSHLPGARLDSVMVTRRVGDKMRAERVNLNREMKGKSKDGMFLLRPDDVVYVPKRWIANAAEVGSYLSDIIFFRGWGLNIDKDDF